MTDPDPLDKTTPRRPDSSTPRLLDSSTRIAGMETGDYRALFGERLAALMTQAAAETGVDDEIAILRIVMARLITEEDDPVILAKEISRVAAVSIQAARARRAINGQLAEGLTEAITSILTDLDGGGS